MHSRSLVWKLERGTIKISLLTWWSTFCASGIFSVHTLANEGASCLWYAWWIRTTHGRSGNTAQRMIWWSLNCRRLYSSGFTRFSSIITQIFLSTRNQLKLLSQRRIFCGLNATVLIKACGHSKCCQFGGFSSSLIFLRKLALIWLGVVGLICWACTLNSLATPFTWQTRKFCNMVVVVGQLLSRRRWIWGNLFHWNVVCGVKLPTSIELLLKEVKLLIFNNRLSLLSQTYLHSCWRLDLCYLRLRLICWSLARLFYEGWFWRRYTSTTLLLTRYIWRKWSHNIFHSECLLAWLWEEATGLRRRCWRVPLLNML